MVNTLMKVMTDCFFDREKNFRKEAKEILRPPRGMTYEVIPIMDDLLYLVGEIVSSTRYINKNSRFLENAVLCYEDYCGYPEGSLYSIFGGKEMFKEICYDLAEKVVSDQRAS